MSDANFYQVLGVERSASADEIRAAYRDLVKKYHPDLFAAAGEKAAATEKLRQINEAYAALGNAERRRDYDQRLVEKQQARPRPPRAAARRRPPRPGRQAAPRRKAKISRARLRFSKKWAGYSLAAATVVLVLIYAAQSEPRLATSWILLEKMEISPAENISPPLLAGEGGWVRVGEYAAVSECAAMLKGKVRQDEQEGSRAVYDERSGLMAITVYINKEAAQKPRITEGGAAVQRSGASKRVRSLECRAMQRVKIESWFRRALRSLGLRS